MINNNKIFKVDLHKIDSTTVYVEALTFSEAEELIRMYAFKEHIPHEVSYEHYKIEHDTTSMVQTTNEQVKEDELILSEDGWRNK